MTIVKTITRFTDRPVTDSSLGNLTMFIKTLVIINIKSIMCKGARGRETC